MSTESALTEIDALIADLPTPSHSIRECAVWLRKQPDPEAASTLAVLRLMQLSLRGIDISLRFRDATKP